MRPATAAEPAASPAPRRSPLPLVLAGVGAAAVIGLAVAVFVTTGAQQGTAAPTLMTSDEPVDPVGNRTVPDVIDVVGRIERGNAVFTWSNPDEQPGDRYRWRLVELAAEHGWDENQLLTEAELAVPAPASGTTCVEVKLVRSSGELSRNATRGCTP